MEREYNKGNEILNLSFEFACQLVYFSDKLAERKKYVISVQLLRSGTSIGANIREAQFPESRKDFYHKMKIAAKEASETEFWLDLIAETKIEEVSPGVREQLKSIINLLSRILTTTRKGMNQQIK